jgi:hypothetical protein
MSGKGLPGFLRRSLRRNFEEENEDDRNSASGANNAPSKPIQAIIPERGASKLPDTLEADEEEYDALHNGSNHVVQGGEGRTSSEGGMKNVEVHGKSTNDGTTNTKSVFISPLVKFDGEHSVASSIASSNNGNPSSSEDWRQDDSSSQQQHTVVPRSMERKYSYRETQFEKVISNDVVKMVELRKLSWNGIPVRLTIFFGGDVLCLWTLASKLVSPTSLFYCRPFSYCANKNVARTSWHGVESDAGIPSY